MVILQARAALGVEIEGIAQVARVNALSLTEQPKYVFCGGDVPCPDITPKTLRVVYTEPPVEQVPVAKPLEREPIKATVHFPFGSHRLTRKAREILSELASSIKVDGAIPRITIDGYTDSIGPKGYNDRLARQRAVAVRKYLISAGIPAERIQIGKTLGKCCYVMPNQTKAGRAANRRAEVVSLLVFFEQERVQ